MAFSLVKVYQRIDSIKDNLFYFVLINFTSINIL